MLDNVNVTLTPDANGDGVVDAADYIILKQNFGTTGSDAGPAVGDFNGDGNVDYADLQTLVNAMKATGGASVPEPGSVILLLCGAGWLLKRRRNGAGE